MKVLAVEDKQVALKALEEAITTAEPDAEVFTFRSAQDALAFDGRKDCEVAFLDVRMPGIDGVDLAKRLKLQNPLLNIIFATGYNDYATDALDMHASGYLLKPITPEKVRKELDNLRHPLRKANVSRLRVRVFGNFEVFIDDEPVVFVHSKTKEYLAYLIDKGTLCTNGEIAAALWERDVNKSYIRVIRKDLIDTLKKAGLEDVFIHQRNRQGIRASAISCDYYDWKKGLPNGLNAYNGEYMSQYSWAENTHALLESGMR